MGNLNDTYENFRQQDASEFVDFLLDGLKEDLNRVKQKGNPREVDTNGKSDKEVA